MVRVTVLCLLASLLGGCVTLLASPYRPAPVNYELLQNKPYKKLALGEFSLASEALNTLTVRDAVLQSPVGESYAAYLKAALDAELYKAGLLGSDATRVLAATITANELKAGLSMGQGSLSAVVTISEGGNELYNKLISVTHEWGSNFVGTLAVTLAADNYPMVVRAFVHKLFSDEDFFRVISN